ncbi:MAG: N-6 DNA methylase, partial [Nitrososphaera sp.]
MTSNISTKLKTIENKLRRDANMSGQIDYNEQIAWMLFLKALDFLEQKQITEAKLLDKKPEYILDEEFRWSSWAIGNNYTSEERYDFVKNKLLPYLRSINNTPIRRLIAQVFEEIPTKLMKSPYGMSEVLELIDSIDLNNPEDTHIVSQFYEESLQKMGSEGRQSGGEFYTPRPVIRFIIKIINPKIGEKILDPFMGSGGFLAETFKYLKEQRNLTAKEYEILQNQTFIGQELKPIPFLLGVMNCILHELYGAKFIRENTFSKNIRTIPPLERVDVILTNPPFGAEIEPILLENFPYST